MEEMAATTGRRWVRRDAAAWRKLLARFEQSGLSQAAFCQRHGVALSSFVRWRQLLIHETKPAPAVASLPTEGLFVELGEAPRSALESRPWDVELQLGPGVVLRLRQVPC